MSEDQASAATDATEAPAPEAPANARKARAPAPTAFRVQATSKCIGQLVDPDRKITITKHTDVKVSGPIAAGSWLDCQIKAGLIEIVE